MPRENALTTDGSEGRARRSAGRRALSAVEESVFFAVVFALGLVLQFAAVLLQASASG
jgi:hypothetical protein